MDEDHLIKITSEASKINEPIQLLGKTERETMTYRTLLFVRKFCNMIHYSGVGQHMKYAGKITLWNNDEQ